ncbi:MAG: SBBP repeat-containing protein [Candidatus Sulfotelmatobacter sp.]
MNVNRSGSGTGSGTSSRISSGTNRFGVLWGAILLLAAGCLLVGSAPRSRTASASPQASRSPLQTAILAADSSAFAPALAGQPTSDQRKPGARALLSQLPLLFEPNLGQVSLGPLSLGQVNSSQSDSGVKFVARGSGYSLFLDSEGATLALRSQAHAGSAARTESVRMKLAGASPSARIAGADLLPGKSNYFIGNDRSKWRSNIPQFARVSYEEVYPGINLVFYGKQGQLEYDFQVAPGADPSQAQLEFDGAQKIELSSGSLILKGDGGSLLFAAPSIYQEIDGRRQPVEGRFALRAANRVGFEVGAYDHSRELIIDPVLTYATFFGGTGNDTFPYITVDILGNIYLTGSTTSPNLPVTVGAYQSTLNSTANAQNIFILKLNPLAGTGGVEYLTYLGGSGTDSSAGIGVDGTTIYVAGTTTSTDFPTTQTAYQTNNSLKTPGNQHVFVSVLNPTVTSTDQLVYSTYLSGSGADIASGMTIDTAGNVYVTGTTTSTALSDEGSLTNQFPASATPEAQPFQATTRGAPIQFFVTKVNTVAAGIGSIAYSTYFGGGAPSNAIATGGGIAVDTTGNIYFTGTTNFIYTGQSPVTDFPILNAYQPCLDTPPPLVIVTGLPVCNNTTVTAPDAFVAKLNNPTNTQATQLAWSTYFGGANNETGTGIAVDAGAANVYITGSTNSPSFILPTTISSFAPYQLCLDTPPPNPTSQASCLTIATPLSNAYVARFNNIAGTSTTTTPTVEALTYFSYLGGTGPDAGLAITVDPASDALITGYTQSENFPIFPNAATCAVPAYCVIQPTNLSTQTPPQNAFFARLNTATLQGQSAVGADVTYYGGTGTDQGTSIAIDQNLNIYFAGDTTSPTLQTLNPLQMDNGGPPGTFDTFMVQLGTAADLAVTNAQLSNPTLSNQVAVGTQVSTVYTITNNGPDLATNVVVLGTIPLGTTFDSASATAGSCSSTVATGGVACTISSMQAGSTATVTIVLTANTPGGYESSASVSSANNIDPNPGNNSGAVSFTATAFIFNVTPTAVAVPAAGDSAFYTVTVTPQPVYGSNVSLSVTGLPGATKSSFSSPSVALSGESPVSSTLTVSTTARPINIGSLRPGRGALYAAFLAFPGMVFLGFGAGFGEAGKRRRRGFAGLLMICMLFGLIWLQPACSGGTTPPPAGGTPPGTYNLVITAAGGTYSKNQTVQLVVP